MTPDNNGIVIVLIKKMGDTFAYGIYLGPDQSHCSIQVLPTHKTPNKCHGNNGSYEMGDTPAQEQTYTKHIHYSGQSLPECA